MKKTARYLLDKKRAGRKITALTAYDYPTAVLEDRAGIDILLVGDSVGTNVLGYESETDVTLADIAHHLKAVKRGTREGFVLADLPYGTYDTPDRALENARVLMECGADGIKLEGLHEGAIARLRDANIPVCGHLGLLPQFHAKKSLQGKTAADAAEILQQAARLCELGAFALVLELVPEELAKLIAERSPVPTIGIGSGPFTDGQVLVVNDILGLTPYKLRLAKAYQNYAELTAEAIAAYAREVETGAFPGRDRGRAMAPDELEKLHVWLQERETL